MVYQNQNLGPRNAIATEWIIVSKNFQHSCEKCIWNLRVHTNISNANSGVQGF